MNSTETAILFKGVQTPIAEISPDIGRKAREALLSIDVVLEKNYGFFRKDRVIVAMDSRGNEGYVIGEPERVSQRRTELGATGYEVSSLITRDGSADALVAFERRRSA